MEDLQGLQMLFEVGIGWRRRKNGGCWERVKTHLQEGLTGLF
jgi:hypothetical protein